MLGLLDRMVVEGANIDVKMKTSIAWPNVDGKIIHLKTKSVSFLKQNLL